MKTLRVLFAGMMMMGLLTQQANAQVNIGAKAGGSFANLTGDDIVDSESHTGLTLGLFVNFEVAPNWQLQVEGSYTQRGAENITTDDGPIDGLDINYIDIPVLLRYTIPMEGRVSSHLMVGPTFSFEASCEIEGEGLEMDCADLEDLDTNSFQFGGLVGGGVEVDVGRFSLLLDGTFDLGFSQIDSDEDGDVKHSGFRLQGGVSIPVGR